MINLESLPAEYIPFSELIVCSNKLVNVSAIISIGVGIPMLIGQGQRPLLWIEMPTKESGFQPLIQANRSLHPLIKVMETEANAVAVYAKDVLIIKAISLTETKGDISRLDLRPLGLDIYGDENYLQIGKTQLKNNTFENLKIMVSIAQPTPAITGRMEKSDT
jgi:hypothetical protein